jgi:hypothetical protein
MLHVLKIWKTLALQCLLHASYVPTSAPKTDPTENQPNDYDEILPASKIKLQNNLGYMHKRKLPAVIRYHYISKEANQEMYHHRFLILYLPWRDEKELLATVDSYTTRFLESESIIDDNITMFEPYHKDIEEVLEDIDPTDYLPDIWDQMASETEKERADTANTTADNKYSYIDLQNSHAILEQIDTSNKRKPFSLNIQNNYQKQDQYYALVRSLNPKQRQLFDFMFNWATDMRLSETRDSSPPEPFYIFLSGGGGVGKTHTINTIYQASFDRKSCR